ncbi:MAG TPA: sulfur carrier protein ThiS [Thermoanaerobaculia bacterium]|jgi:thiamine biosynthesis protein ThiS
MISLTINGRDVRLENAMTIAQLLASKNLHAKIVVVEHNRQIVPRERYDAVLLGAGDELEIVQMMAGG